MSPTSRSWSQSRSQSQSHPGSWSHASPRVLAATALVFTVSALIATTACGSGDLLVGDDSRTDGAPGTNEGGAPPVDSGRPTENEGGTKDSGPDGDPPATACAAPGGPGTCIPTGTMCQQPNKALTCSAGSFCCVLPCPELIPPPPSFCDGGPYAPTYNAQGCTNGFACAPLACTSAGGACVGVAPGSCTTGHIGDATKYSCGPGVGVMCCLP